VSASRRFALCLSVATLSCTAYRLPPQRELAPHSQPESLGNAAIDRSLLPRYLADHQADEFLTRLRDDLAATGLFDSVVVGEAPGRETVVVDDRSAPLALWGWIAGPIAPLPGWSFTLPVERERADLRSAIEQAIAPARASGD